MPSDDNVQEAKYKNGQESPVFSKSRLLYGLDRARDAIVKQGMAIVVEGYMDCIAAQQSGVTNTVASLGTALTDQHVAILKRFAPRCVMVYDGDRAGQDAAEKSIPRFLPQEVDLKILTLTDDQDPADVCLKLGGDWFRQQAAEAPEVWEFKLRRVRGRHDVRSVDGAQKVLDEMLQALADVPALLGSAPAGSWQLRENILLARLSHWLSIPEQAVRERLAEFRKIKQTPRPERVTDNRPSQESQQDEWNKRVQRTMRKPTVDELLEAEVLQLVLIVPGVLPQIREQVSAEDWTNPFFRELWELCLQEDGAGQHAAFEQISNRVEQPHLQRLLVWLDAVGRDKGVSAELVNSTLDGLRRRRLTRERARLQDGAGLPADSTTKPHLDSRTLLQRAVELHRRRNNEPNG